MVWKNSARNRPMASIEKRKIKFMNYDNNLGYDEVVREKQEEYAIWYEGDSDLLLDYYINSRGSKFKNYEDFRNRVDYFWAAVGREPEVKCTHSGLPKAMINTLVNILGIPDITVSKDVTEDGKLKTVEDIAATARLQEIAEDNDFSGIFTQDQLPFTMVIGDGAYFINIDHELSDYPIIEFIDGRNVEFLRKANRIIAVTARKYYNYNNQGYMLTDTRSTEWQKDDKGTRRRVATVEYHLYRLKNVSDDEVAEEVELETIPDTAKLQNLKFNNIDCMLAVPCIFRYNKNTERGESFFSGKLDLFDDLDQSKSQSSNCTRLSTPVEYIPEGLTEYDSNGLPKPFHRYDRRYQVMPADRNAVGQNLNQVQTTQPALNFAQYSADQLELVADILSGLMSPATLGIELARKDNAAAQREKEKITLITRDNMVTNTTVILKKIWNVVLKVHDYMMNANNGIIDYDITVNFPEYANPTFENKLAYLAPVWASGGISAQKYVEELWSDSLTDEEIEKEVETLERYKNAAYQEPEEQAEQAEDYLLT